ncbi:aldehyde dehydrogenase family protein [Lichenicoccus sp.]|uniref:aldehyde dehydrogenase family protein n=1 Tax=Lichenicoccus sp. TaxID=2781899 RepID=UPI003D11315E
MSASVSQPPVFLIDGAWSSDGAADWFTLSNPANGQPIARIAVADAAVVDRAVQAARRAFPAWRDFGPYKRADLLRELALIVDERRDGIARAVTREQGKPLDEARGEVSKVARTFEYYAAEAVRVFGQTIPNEDPGFLSLVEKEPIGVAAAIAPWNYPVELIGWKLGGALAAGCTLVVKPSEYSPLSAVALLDCVLAAGFPPGVVNLVQGAGKTGAALVSHPGIDKIAFTGSASVGETIFRTMGGIKSVSLELGGNCPMVVASSADVDAAVKGALRRGFRNMGQICIAVNRIYVHRSLHQRFVQQLVHAAERLTIADGLERPSADLGPMTNADGIAKVERHVADALDRGAALLCGGGPPAGMQQGHFYAPTVFDNCTPDMLVMSEETFGPVLGVCAFDSIDEVIGLANAGPYGLAAYVYARDVAEIFGLTRALCFGSIAVNTVDAGIMNAPYGGRKQSGIGYEHGREGMEGYLAIKHVRLKHGA